MKKASDKRTHAQLAAELGTSRQVITWHCKKAGAPPLSDVEAWRKYLEGKNAGTSTKLSNQIGKERLRIARATAEKVERENKVRNGEVIEFAEVRRHALDINSFFFGELDRLRQTLPALLKGRPELEIFTTLESEIGKIKLGLKTRLEGMNGE